MTMTREQLKERANIAAAFFEGKSVEVSTGSEWVSASEHICPEHFFSSLFKFRLAPTSEEKRIANNAALKAGYETRPFPLQYRWSLTEQWADLRVFPTWSPDCEYRRKPAPTMVPWTTQTCPVGTVVRPKGAQSRCLITHAGIKMFMTGDGSEHLYEIALRAWETESGQPCGTTEATQ